MAHKLPQCHFIVFLHFGIEIKNKKQVYIFLESSKCCMWLTRYSLATPDIYIQCVLSSIVVLKWVPLGPLRDEFLGGNFFQGGIGEEKL